MKKRIVASMLGMALLAGWPLMAAEMADMKGMTHNSEYCTKHCNSMQLGKEVKALESEIAADKAAMKGQGTGEKTATLMAKKEQLKKHIAQHEKELEDMKAKLDKADAEMKQ